MASISYRSSDDMKPPACPSRSGCSGRLVVRYGVAMGQQHDFPPVTLIAIEELVYARDGSFVELRPLSDRPAPQEWRRLYHRAAEADPRVNWLPASLARCKPEDREATAAGLRDACGSANRDYQAFLNDAPLSEAMNDRLTIEGIAAASADGDAYPIHWP